MGYRDDDELTPEQGYVQSRVELSKAGHNFGSKERQ